MFIKFRLSNNNLENEFVGLKLALNGSTSFKGEVNGVYTCIVKYLGKSYDVSFYLDSESYALLSEIKEDNVSIKLDPSKEVKLLYASVAFLRNRGKKYSSFTMLERVDKTLASMNYIGKNNSFAIFYFALTIAGFLSMKELENKIETIDSLMSALILSRRKRFDWDETTIIVFTLAQFLEFSKEELLKLAKNRYGSIISNCLHYEVHYYFVSTFCYLDKESINVILEAILETLNSNMRTSKNTSKYISLAELAIRYDKLSEDFAKAVLSLKDISGHYEFSYIVQYALENNYEEALKVLDKNAVSNLYSSVFIPFIRYAIDHHFSNCSDLLDSVIYSSSFSFSDYVWYESLNIPQSQRKSENILELIADQRGFLGAFLVYNHRTVSQSQLKNIPIKDLVFLKEILLKEYRKSTTNMLVEQINRKLSYKNIDYKSLLRYMSLLREFSPVEYAKMRNNRNVKMYLANSVSFRYEDVISLYKKGELEDNKIYIYKK